MYEENFALHLNTHKGAAFREILVHIYYRLLYCSRFKPFTSAALLLKICTAQDTNQPKHTLAINNHYDYTDA